MNNVQFESLRSKNEILEDTKNKFPLSCINQGVKQFSTIIFFNNIYYYSY